MYRENEAVQVAKKGSLAVRLPAAVVKALGPRESDEIEIHVEGERSSELEFRRASSPQTSETSEPVARKVSSSSAE